MINIKNKCLFKKKLVEYPTTLEELNTYLLNVLLFNLLKKYLLNMCLLLVIALESQKSINNK